MTAAHGRCATLFSSFSAFPFWMAPVLYGDAVPPRGQGFLGGDGGRNGVVTANVDDEVSVAIVATTDGASGAHTQQHVWPCSCDG